MIDLRQALQERFEEQYGVSAGIHIHRMEYLTSSDGIHKKKAHDWMLP
jgi:hypothetical protein